MVRARDVVQSGVVGLECLVECVLKVKLSKVPSVHISQWSVSQLSPKQINYSALGVIKALEVYFKLCDMPDLTARLTLHDTTLGKVVDIVPLHGSIHLLAKRAAIACIEPHGEDWMTLHGCRPTKLTVTPD
jgi:ribonuclease D